MTDDPLHPTGRCICSGDGACEWCLSHCIHCGTYVWPYLEGDVEDYEALGYPETQQLNPGRFKVDKWVDRLLWQMEEAGVNWARWRPEED